MCVYFCVCGARVVDSVEMYNPVTGEWTEHGSEGSHPGLEGSQHKSLELEYVEEPSQRWLDLE